MRLRHFVSKDVPIIYNIIAIGISENEIFPEVDMTVLLAHACRMCFFVIYIHCECRGSEWKSHYKNIKYI